MKKLIFLLEYKKCTGGMMQSSLSVIRGLSEKGYLIKVICQPGSEVLNMEFNSNVSVLSTKRDWYMHKENPLKTLRTAWQVYKVIKNDIKDSILVSNDLGASFLISLLPARHKEVFVCRGGRFTGFAGRTIRNKIKRGIYWTVATSSFQRDFIESHCGEVKRISVIHNGLKMPEKVYEKPQLLRDNLKISVVGYIAPDKNQAEGVRLIKLLRDNGIAACLNIYGTIECHVDEVYNQELQKLIDKLNIRDFINFKGFATQTEIYANTDVLISFSYAEGFGRTLVEAMLRNRPVIAYRGAGGPIDITDNGNVGYLVNNNTAEDYYNVIIDMLSDDYRAYKMIDKAREYALQHFTEEVMVSNYDKLFTNL